MSDAKKPDQQHKPDFTITIPAPDPDAKNPWEMTPEELKSYNEAYKEAVDRGMKRFDEKIQQITKSLNEVILTTSIMAIDTLRDYLAELSQRLIDRTITAEELTKLTDILRDAGAFGLAEPVDKNQLSLFSEEDRKREEEAIALKALPHLLNFKDGFVPMLNGEPDRDIMQLSARGKKADGITHTATFVTKSGHKVKIEHFDELQAVLGTSAKKIFDTALLFLTSANFYRSKPDRITPTVEIPLIEYGEANGYQLTPRTMDTPEEQTAENRRVNERIKELKKSIRRDLNGYKNTTWSGEVTKGRNRGDYKDLNLISSHSITRGIIRINFDIDAATFYVNSFVGQYPTVLLRHDNRKPNAYSIGRKIAFHNSNDNNRAIGTENTLSVRSLLDAAPDIPTIDDIKDRGQRNWKDKIKKSLELALDENIVIGYLSRWEYRDPRTGTTYTPADAQLLTWTQYSRLMVDFAVINAPEQNERRAARALEKAKAAADKEKPKRKRGRPRKAEKKEGGN